MKEVVFFQVAAEAHLVFGEAIMWLILFISPTFLIIHLGLV